MTTLLPCRPGRPKRRERSDPPVEAASAGRRQRAARHARRPGRARRARRRRNSASSSSPVCESAVDPLEICQRAGVRRPGATRQSGSPTAIPMCSRWPRRCTCGCHGGRPSRRAAGSVAGWPRQRRPCTGCSTDCPRSASRPPPGCWPGPAWSACWSSCRCVSWAVSQALAYLGYLRLGQADAGLAARLLRAGLGRRAGRGAARPGRGRPGAARPDSRRCSSRAGLGGYMLGATVLHRAGRRTAAAGRGGPRRAGRRRVPAAGQAGRTHRSGLGGAGGHAAAGPGARPRVRRAAGAAPAPVRQACGGHAARAPAGQARAGRGGRWSPARNCAVRCQVPGSGWSRPGLFAFPVAAGLPGHAATPAVLVSLPLALSMGAAEWIAHLVPAAHPAAAARHRGTAGVRHPGAAGAAGRAAAVPGR